MSKLGSTRWRRLVGWPTLAAGLLVVSLLAGACGGDEATLQGVVRTDPLVVGQVELPEVTPGSEQPSFAFASSEDRLLVVYFGYLSCPDVCPTTMVDVRGALAELGADADRIDVAFVTVDPDRDTPELLDTYLDHFFDRYHALRPATPEQLTAAEEAFTASSSVTVTEDGTVEVAHSATTYVVGPDGTVLVEWAFGTPSDVMAEDLRLLLADRVSSS